MQRHRTDLQHERSALAWLLQTQQRAAAEMRTGLESVLKQAAAMQQVEARRHAAALAEVREGARRQAASEQASAQAALLKVQEERGEAMLKAEQLHTEAARLREMVGTLKRHDDELYAAQSGATVELNQLRASLAAAEERVAASRIALDDESTRCAAMRCKPTPTASAAAAPSAVATACPRGVPRRR
jgi:chromosome segregation ATPase